MKKVLIALVLFTALSCKKDKATCYECQKTFGSTVYTDEGCYTSEEWSTHGVADNLGNSLDKNNKCRKK